MKHLCLIALMLATSLLSAEADSTKVKDVGPTANILMRTVRGSTRMITLYELINGLGRTLGFKTEISPSVAAKRMDLKFEEITMAELFKKAADATGCTFKSKDGVIRFATEEEMKSADAGGEFKAFKESEKLEERLPGGNVNFWVGDFGMYIVDGYTEETVDDRIAAGQISYDDLAPLIDNYNDQIKNVAKASRDRANHVLSWVLLMDLTFKPTPKCLGETAARLTRILKNTEIKVSQSLGDKKVAVPVDAIRVYALLKNIQKETGCKIWWTPGDIGRPGSKDIPHVIWLYTPEELAKVQTDKAGLAEWKGEVTLPDANEVTGTPGNPDIQTILVPNE